MLPEAAAAAQATNATSRDDSGAAKRRRGKRGLSTGGNNTERGSPNSNAERIPHGGFDRKFRGFGMYRTPVFRVTKFLLPVAPTARGEWGWKVSRMTFPRRDWAAAAQTFNPHATILAFESLENCVTKQ